MRVARCFLALLACAPLVLRVEARAASNWSEQEAEAIAASQKGAFDKAEALLHSALASLESSNGLEAVQLWNQLGLVHEAETRSTEAKEDYQHAIDIDRRLPHPSKVLEVVVLSNLGTVLQTENDFKAAEKYFRQAYSELTEAHLTEIPSTGPVLSNLALDLQQQGRFSESAGVFQEAMEAFHKSKGEDTAEFAKCLTNLGMLNYETGHFREAVAEHKRALEIRNKLSSTPVSVRDQAYLLNNLGLALGELGIFDEAKAALLNAIALEKSNPARLDRRLPETLNNLAELEKNMGNLSLARQYNQQALEFATQLRANNDTIRAVIWTNLGMLAAREHDYQAAKRLYEQAADLWLKTVGPKSPKYAATMSDFAALEAMKGHQKKAKEIFSESLQIDETCLGPKHPQVAQDLANMAAQWFFEKKYTQAIDFYNRAKAIDEISLGPEAQKTALIWRNLGIVYQTAKQYDESQKAYKNAIHILEMNPVTPPELLPCLRSSAYVLRKLERYGEAEQADLKASSIEVRSAIDAERAQNKGIGGLGFRN